MESTRNERIPLVISKRVMNIRVSREKEQFCNYIRDYKLNMFRLAKSILHNDADAEDATGEAIVKAYSHLSSLKSFKSFKPWIMKIVVNEAYTIANKRNKVMYLEELKVTEESTEDNTGELWTIVNTLEEEFRIIAVLFYYEDMRIRDIAKALDIPAGTVKSRLARAREKLRVLITEEGGK